MVETLGVTKDDRGHGLGTLFVEQRFRVDAEPRDVGHIAQR